MDLVREVSFSKLHVFKFSGRPDTPAAVMPGQVMEKVKSERSRILREAGDEIREDYLKHNIGKTAEIVCEEFDSKNNLLCGTSGNYIRVYIKVNHGDADGMVPKGKMIKVSTGPRFRDGLSGIMKK